MLNDGIVCKSNSGEHVVTSLPFMDDVLYSFMLSSVSLVCCEEFTLFISGLDVSCNSTHEPLCQ